MVINFAPLLASAESTTRYHLPYVLNRKGIAGMSRTYFFAAMRSRKNRPHLFPYPFHQRSRRSAKRSRCWLVVVCTHADSHFSTRSALEAGKNVLVENRSPDNCAGERAVCTGESKGLIVTPYQNRRFDSCFLKKSD